MVCFNDLWPHALAGRGYMRKWCVMRCASRIGGHAHLVLGGMSISCGETTLSRAEHINNEVIPDLGATLPWAGRKPDTGCPTNKEQ